MIPYCQVVSYAFSKSKKRPTACCLRANASRRYLSRLTRWSVVLRCFLKPHWLLSNIPDFSRYQMKRVLIMRSRTLHKQLVSAIGLELRGSVWSLFGLGIGITVAALHWWGKSVEVHILFRISFRIFSVSSGRCFNRLLCIPSGPGAQGFGLHDWPPQISQSERLVVNFSVVWVEVNFVLLFLLFYGLECSTVVGRGGVVCKCCCMFISNIFRVGDGRTILPI